MLFILWRISKVELSSHSSKLKERKIAHCVVAAVWANEIKNGNFLLFCLQFLDTSWFRRFFFSLVYRWQLHIGTREETIFQWNAIIITCFIHSMRTEKWKKRKATNIGNAIVFVCNENSIWVFSWLWLSSRFLRRTKLWKKRMRDGATPHTII